MPAETRHILNRRSLATGHRRLGELVRPGFAVLDVGCGTGAITRGVAELAGPGGRAVGIDVNASLIAEARAAHREVPGLAFTVADVYALPFDAEFDVVTAARVLQWLADPAGALAAMGRAARPGGRIVALDYNHEKVLWRPAPPATMQAFYAAFLRWRAEAGMDNAIADHLAELFVAAGLRDVEVSPQHEAVERGEPGFEAAAGIWADVAATRGRQMVADGVIDEAARAAAEADHRAWVHASAESQCLYLLAVEGIRR
jgi:ubiquinone/menaquinone biosynthesis C-methylase UbiE